jgi:cytochrome c-type biogenesis protein CcmH
VRGTAAVRRVAALAAVIAGLAVPGAAVAQDCPKTSLGAVEAEVMCIVCGTPLALASEAPQANRERALIQRLVDRCQSKEQIKAAMVAEFGEDVLALPEAEGFDAAAYVVPALAILLAAGGVAFAARRWRQSGGGRPAAAAPGADPDAAKRLDADLERYEL